MRPVRAPGTGWLALALAMTMPAQAADSAAAHRAWVDYALHCQGCHLPGGEGMAGKVPAMRGALADFLKVPGGREYLVQVPGVATAKLSDADVARLLNWLVRAMGPDLPAGFHDYQTAEVAALRTHWLRSPGPVRKDLLAAIAALPARS